MRSVRLLFLFFILTLGCTVFYVREYATKSNPVMIFENWRIYIHVRAQKPTKTEPPLSSGYYIHCLAWTLPGNWIKSNETRWRKSDYELSFGSLKIVYNLNGETKEILFPDAHGGESDNPQRMVSLSVGREVNIPLDVENIIV